MKIYTMKSLFTSILLTLSVTTFAQIPSYVPSNGLVGWWPFNGNANDESGNGNNGTVNGATLTADRFGNSNASYYFANNKIEVPHNSSLGIQQFQGFSVSVWAKKNPGVLTTHLMGKRPSGAQNFNWHIADWEGAQFSSTSAPYVFGAITMIPVDTSNWMHIVGVYNNGTWSIFLNGTLTLSNTVPYFHPDVNIPLVFGNSGDWGGFMGKLDDIGIWNRALTACEIQDLYQGQLGFTIVDAGVDQSVCRGEQVTLQGSGASTFVWNNGVVNGIPFEPTQSGSYVLTGTDSIGCSGTDTVTITVLENASSTINQTAIDSYTLNGQTYTLSGTYTQVIPAANGCDSVITLNLELDFTGIENNTPTSFKLYPNPNNGHFTILLPENNGSAKLEVLDLKGRIIFESILDQQSSELHLESLSSGTYWLRINQQVPVPVTKY